MSLSLLLDELRTCIRDEEQWAIYSHARCAPIICIWVVLFSPLPFWFSHIGFYRSLFIHLMLSIYFHFFFSICIAVFQQLCAAFSTVSTKKKVRDFCRWLNFSWSVGRTICTLTHWRRYIKWNKLAEALFIIAFFVALLLSLCAPLTTHSIALHSVAPVQRERDRKNATPNIFRIGKWCGQMLLEFVCAWNDENIFALACPIRWILIVFYYFVRVVNAKHANNLSHLWWPRRAMCVSFCSSL